VPDDDPAPAEQLRFKLEQDPPTVRNTATILTFIDAETRAVRKDAINRVKSSGIFEPPASDPLR
jgi:hypothetical protein